MKKTLKVGDKVTFQYKVPETKTVPNLYPDSPDFETMPGVFATGFMVGLMEWTCMKVIEPHLDPGEGSLGVHIDVSHLAATLPGQVVTVEAECTGVASRLIAFNVSAHDGIDLIGQGRHERMVVPWDRFEAKVNDKAKQAGLPPVQRKKG